MADPYVPAKPNDIITSDKWNQIQIQTREEIQRHRHTGGADGTKIPGEGIDPSANVAIATLKVGGRDFASELARIDAKIDSLGSALKQDLANQVGQLSAQIGSIGQALNINVGQLNARINALSNSFNMNGPLQITGGNWDVWGSEGDLRIGNSSYWLRVGVALGGGGAGDARIRAGGGTNRLMLGSTQFDVLTVDDTRVGIGTITPSHVLHVLTDSAVGLFESTSTQAFLRFSTSEGINNRVEICNRPGGMLTLWVAGAGDVFRIEKDGKIHLGSNVGGPFVQLNDDVWFSDPQNGTIQVRNGNNTGWGTLIGTFAPPSSLEYKRDVERLTDADLEALFADTMATDLVHFKYKGEEADRTRLGVIAEWSPRYLVSKEGKGLSVAEYISMLHGALKVLARRLDEIEKPA